MHENNRPILNQMLNAGIAMMTSRQFPGTAEDDFWHFTAAIRFISNISVTNPPVNGRFQGTGSFVSVMVHHYQFFPLCCGYD
jgi:hypothetical protein